jgi:hypothetical protein
MLSRPTIRREVQGLMIQTLTEKTRAPLGEWTDSTLTHRDAHRRSRHRQPRDSDRFCNRHLRRLDLPVTLCRINKTCNSNRQKTALFSSSFFEPTSPMPIVRCRRASLPDIAHRRAWHSPEPLTATVAHSPIWLTHTPTRRKQFADRNKMRHVVLAPFPFLAGSLHPCIFGNSRGMVYRSGLEPKLRGNKTPC